MSPWKLQRRRWIAALVLAVYGTGGLLGYGLHALAHAEHAASCHASHHCCHSHQAGLVASQDDCSICAYLAQAQTDDGEEAPLLVTTISQADPPVSERPAVSALVLLQLARGPPLA